MTRGSKTRAAGLTALSSIPLVFIDPTGTAALTVVLSGTAAALGATYHIGRKSKKLICKEMEENRQSKTEKNNIIDMSISTHKAMQQDVEAN